jgi:hypothetical protein
MTSSFCPYDVNLEPESKALLGVQSGIRSDLCCNLYRERRFEEAEKDIQMLGEKQVEGTEGNGSVRP